MYKNVLKELHSYGIPNRKTFLKIEMKKCELKIAEIKRRHELASNTESFRWVGQDIMFQTEIDNIREKFSQDGQVMAAEINRAMIDRDQKRVDELSRRLLSFHRHIRYRLNKVYARRQQEEDEHRIKMEQLNLMASREEDEVWKMLGKFKATLDALSMEMALETKQKTLQAWFARWENINNDKSEATTKKNR